MADGRQSRALMIPSELQPHDEESLLSEESGWRYCKFTKVSPCSNSPVEPDFGFGGTGSDEDDEYDYVSELTRQVAQDLREDYRTAARNIVVEKDEKSWVLVGSPQSTLWSPLGSSKGSSEGPSLDPSPPATPPSGAVELSLSEILSNRQLTDNQTRAFQLYKLKQEQITRLESSLRRRKEAEPEHKVPQSEKNHTDFRPPPVQESGRRSAFSGGSCSRNGSCGTGVFLPREIEDPPSSSSRKKQACSTILIPARVVQALKLHYDKTGTNSRLNISSLPPQQDALMSLRGGVYSLEKRTTSATSQSQKGHQYHSLPQKWTY